MYVCMYMHLCFEGHGISTACDMTVDNSKDKENLVCLTLTNLGLYISRTVCHSKLQFWLCDIS